LPDEKAPEPPTEPPTIAAAPPIVPTHPGETAAADASLRDAVSAAVRRAEREARGPRRWPRAGLSAAVLALVMVIGGLIALRTDVVRLFPQTATLYARVGLPVNLRGLVFNNVTTETETSDGVQVLVVAGTIASTATRIVDVPRLRFAVRNDSGHEIYTWTALPPKSVITPGATLAFRSRLASPPREGNDVVVRFFNRRDRVAGIQ
jgi:hypothetical protein